MFRLKYRLLSLGSGTIVYFLNWPLSVSIPLSVPLSPVSSLTALSPTVVDGHCSSPKPINSGVPQGSVLSPTLFLLFINDLLSVTHSPIHSYADDSTLHFSTSFDRRPTPQDLQDSRLEVVERLTSDLALI